MNIIVYRYRRRPRRRLPFTAVGTKAPVWRRKPNLLRRIPKKVVYPLQQRFVFTVAAAAPVTTAPVFRRKLSIVRRLPKKIIYPLQQRVVLTKTDVVRAYPLPPATRRRVRWPQPKIYKHQQKRLRFVVLSLTYSYRRITLYDRNFSLTVEDRSSSLRLVDRPVTITLADVP